MSVQRTLQAIEFDIHYYRMNDDWRNERKYVKEQEDWWATYDNMTKQASLATFGRPL